MNRAYEGEFSKRKLKQEREHRAQTLRFWSAIGRWALVFGVLVAVAFLCGIEI